MDIHTKILTSTYGQLKWIVSEYYLHLRNGIGTAPPTGFNLLAGSHFSTLQHAIKIINFCLKLRALDTNLTYYYITKKIRYTYQIFGSY